MAKESTSEQGKNIPTRSPIFRAIVIFILLALMILALVLSVNPYFYTLESLYNQKWVLTGEKIGTIATIPVGKMVQDKIQAEQKVVATQRAPNPKLAPTEKSVTSNTSSGSSSGSLKSN